MQRSMLKLVSIADLFSITNALFGIFAIFFLLYDFLCCLDLRIRVSFSFILLGLLADGIDGIIARKTRKSEIGEYLESMADMTTLVIAPSVFIYFIYIDSISGSIYRVFYLLFALILFLFFGIIRLASFHIMKEDKFFIGLPASASTILLIIPAYLQVDFIYILPMVIIIGAAMASDIKFLKTDTKINGVAFILILLTLILSKDYQGFAPILLFIAILVYSIGGPLYIRFLMKK